MCFPPSSIVAFSHVKNKKKNDWIEKFNKSIFAFSLDILAHLHKHTLTHAFSCSQLLCACSPSLYGPFHSIFAIQKRYACVCQDQTACTRQKHLWYVFFCCMRVLACSSKLRIRLLVLFMQNSKRNLISMTMKTKTKATTTTTTRKVRCGTRQITQIKVNEKDMAFMFQSCSVVRRAVRVHTRLLHLYL